MPDDIKEIIEKNFNAVEQKLGAKFDDYHAELEAQGEVSKKTASEVKGLADQYGELSDELTEVKDSLVALEQKGQKGDLSDKSMSLGQQFINSESFGAFQTGQQQKARVSFENNTIVGDTADPEIVDKDYVQGIIGGAFRPLNVLDAIMVGQTSSNTVHYVKEATYTNNAAERAEAAAKPESVLTFEGVDEPVRAIAHFLKASKQILEDAPMIASYIDRRLSHGVQQRLQHQIINGTGVSPDLSGILAAGNFTPVTSQADYFDTANKAKEQVLTADYVPSAYLVNPQDWGTMERTKTGITGDNSYVAGGGGTINYVANGLQPILWGLPVIASNSVPVGTVICLSREALMLFERSGVVVEAFEQDEDNVQNNLITIRAEMRAALAVFRPAAIVAGDWTA